MDSLIAQKKCCPWCFLTYNVQEFYSLFPHYGLVNLPFPLRHQSCHLRVLHGQASQATFREREKTSNEETN